MDFKMQKEQLYNHSVLTSGDFFLLMMVCFLDFSFSFFQNKKKIEKENFHGSESCEDAV